MMSHTSNRLPPTIPTTNSSSVATPESECMKVQIDLMEKRAHLVSPKPVRIKLIWLKNTSNSDEAKTNDHKGKFLLTKWVV